MTSSPLRTALGLMSGTSLDGIDAALIRTDGISHVETGAHLTIPYGDEFRAQAARVAWAARVPWRRSSAN